MGGSKSGNREDSDRAGSGHRSARRSERAGDSRSTRETFRRHPVTPRRHSPLGCNTFLTAGISLLLWIGSASAQVPEDATPPALRGVGLDQRLGEEVPRDLTFLDESGQRVQLRDYFAGCPVILTLN